ncbi:MAG TPA: hypothetical protein VGT79_03565 [Xanthomonadaceae bacterium]|nr:hypothetical protein [Xanthomonadaceae bacterium]
MNGVKNDVMHPIFADLLKSSHMASSCPHCGGGIPIASLMRSTSGVGRYFHCMGCRRRLSVGYGRKVAYASVVLLSLIGSCAYSVRENSSLLYLVFPIVAMLASLLVCWRARLRIVDCGSRWFSMLHFGILGLVVGVLGYAIVP